MTNERPNPDIFWTDEEVADMKAKGVISEEKPPVDKSGLCCICGEQLKENQEGICDDCIPF